MENTVSTAELIAYSVAADRINGGYVRKDDFPTPETGHNSLLIVNLVSNPDENLTAEDFEMAGKIIAYYETQLFGVMTGEAHDYVKTCCGIVNKELTNLNDMKTVAVIASLPNSFRKTIKYLNQQEIINHAKDISNSIGSIGSKFAGAVKIIKSQYSNKYCCWYNTAITSEGNLINWISQALILPSEENDGCLYISGKVKNWDEANRTTRLNYVKIIPDKVEKNS